MADAFRVYWQPGCSSCLKAKEFLSSQGVAFESINVLADADGMADLQALGARSVPVVSRGSDFVFAQNLNDVAKFVGVARQATVLPVPDLVERVDRILKVAQSHVCLLPQSQLVTHLPGRDRTYLDLGYHIFVIPEAFLISARGGTLTYDMFERRPPSDIATGLAVSVYGELVRQDFAAWWIETGKGERLPVQLATYYGEQLVPDLLERTAWHAAQHTRQLAAVLETLGIETEDDLSDSDLAGLPLPDHVYDDQVPLSAKTS